jgi:hypothetical protein
MAEQEGFETQLGRLEIADGGCTRAGKVADRFIVHRGNIDREEIPGAHQPGQWHGVTPVSFDAVTGLLGHQRGRHDPAVVAFVGEIPVEPVATGTGFIDKEQMLGLGLHVADKVVKVTWAGADGPEVGALSAVLLRDVSDGH